METPGERGDRLAQEGYRLWRTSEFGVYLLERPDGLRTYRIDCAANSCNCQATTYCKHLAFAYRYWTYDRAVVDLAEARDRDVLVWECESALSAAESVLAAICAGRDREARRQAA